MMLLSKQSERDYKSQGYQGVSGSKKKGYALKYVLKKKDIYSIEEIAQTVIESRIFGDKPFDMLVTRAGKGPYGFQTLRAAISVAQKYGYKELLYSSCRSSVYCTDKNNKFLKTSLLPLSEPQSISWEDVQLDLTVKQSALNPSSMQ